MLRALRALLIPLRTLAALLMLRPATFFVHGIERRRRGGIIKSFRFFSHDAAADEAFERAEFALIFVRNKTDGIADGVRPAGAADAMNVILSLHREIIIHDVRNAVHVNATRGDVRRHEHPHGTGFKIFQRFEALIL